MAFEFLRGAPWPFLIAFASLGILLGAFQGREGLLRRAGFSKVEVALLALGSIAGWSLHIPLLPVGNAYVAVNLGGAVVPLLLVLLWVREGKLSGGITTLGIAFVSVVAWRVSRVEPGLGVVSAYPDFFLPSVAAFLFALAVSPRNPARSIPLAYASGSLGSLVGADLLHLPQIFEEYGRADGDSLLISIGGAGVFDMVFLAGALAMAGALLVVLVLSRGEGEILYPPERPARIWSTESLLSSYRLLSDPTPEERALAFLARSNEALLAGEKERSVRWAHAAVALLLEAYPPPLLRIRGRVPRELVEDLEHLRIAATQGEVSSRDALEANEVAKRIVASLRRKESVRLLGGTL